MCESTSDQNGAISLLFVTKCDELFCIAQPNFTFFFSHI